LAQQSTLLRGTVQQYQQGAEYRSIHD